MIDRRPNASLTHDTEKRLDEADALASSSTTRLSKSEVFDSVRSRINEQSKK